MSTGRGILTTHADLTVETWNDWLASVSGLSESDVHGRPLLDLVAQQSRDSLADLFNEVMACGTARVLASAFHQCLIPCPPEEPSPYFDHMQQSVTIAPIIRKGIASGLIVTVEDVTGARDQARALAARIASRDATPTTDVLLAAAVSTDWRVRGQAIHGLSQSASDDAVTEVLQLLERQHLDLNVLSSVLQVLVAARRSVTGPLTRLLKGANSNLRMHAAQALGLLRDRAALPDLIEALGDDDPNVRFHAMEALGSLRRPRRSTPSWRSPILAIFSWPFRRSRRWHGSVTLWRYPGSWPCSITKSCGRPWRMRSVDLVMRSAWHRSCI